MHVTTFSFTAELWVELFREGSIIGRGFGEKAIVTTGFPQGAVIRDVRFVDYGMRHGQIDVLVEHESFPELGDGDSIWTTHTEVVATEVITQPEPTEQTTSV